MVLSVKIWTFVFGLTSPKYLINVLCKPALGLYFANLDNTIYSGSTKGGNGSKIKLKITHQLHLQALSPALHFKDAILVRSPSGRTGRRLNWGLKQANFDCFQSFTANYEIIISASSENLIEQFLLASTLIQTSWCRGKGQAENLFWNELTPIRLSLLPWSQ